MWVTFWKETFERDYVKREELTNALAMLDQKNAALDKIWAAIGQLTPELQSQIAQAATEQDHRTEIAPAVPDLIEEMQRADS